MRQNIKTTNTALKYLHTTIVTQIDYSKQIMYKLTAEKGLKGNKSPLGKLKPCDLQNG